MLAAAHLMQESFSASAMRQMADSQARGREVDRLACSLQARECKACMQAEVPSCLPSQACLRQSFFLPAQALSTCSGDVCQRKACLSKAP